MTEYDDLRRVFDELAAHPPLALGRKEAVMSRVSRRLQRQAVVRGAGGLALAVVLGAGAVSTTLHLQQTGSDGAATVVTSSTPSGEPTHQSKPSHEPSHAATEPTQGPASTEPTHATTEPTTQPTTQPSHEATVAPTTGPSPENTAASGPLTVSVEMSPSTVDTSTDTHALVTARDGEGRLLAVDIDWGDGTTFHFSPTGTVSCPRTTHLDGSFVHRYSTPGTYAPHVTVTSGDCAPTEKVTREAHVTVTGSEPSPSATSTNGPAAPQATVATRSGDNASYVYITAGGSDADGWISRIVVHWGDGAESAFPYSTSGCTNGPSSQTSSVPGGHHYASAGSYTVTVTVTSVACDGTQAQTGSTSMSVQSP
jgi:hypothetical protein